MITCKNLDSDIILDFLDRGWDLKVINNIHCFVDHTSVSIKYMIKSHSREIPIGTTSQLHPLISHEPNQLPTLPPYKRFSTIMKEDPLFGQKNERTIFFRYIC